jgi:UDP-N-acetylmuramoylalanine--D-glutamate ligase
MRHLQDQTVLILGLGASGLAMARWCVRHGASVTVADTREAPAQLATLREELPGVAFVSGAFTPALVQGTAVRAVYRSPGLAPDVIAPVVDAAREIGLPVGGELDLFSRALADLRDVPVAQLVEEAPETEAPLASPEPAPEALQPEEADASDEAGAPEAMAVADSLEDDIALPADPSDDTQATPDAVDQAAGSTPAALEEGGESVVTPALLGLVPPEKPTGYRPEVLAITGTNGKTTVTSLLGQLVQRAGKTVAVAGNIGRRCLIRCRPIWMPKPCRRSGYWSCPASS